MRTGITRRVGVAIAISVIGGALAGCSTTSSSTPTSNAPVTTPGATISAPGAPSGSAGSSAAVPAYATEKGVQICLSNSDVTSSFRAQAIADFEAEAKKLQATGEVSKYTVQSAGQSVPNQIQDMHNMVAAGCQVMLINAASSTGLNAAVTQAKNAGVTVVTYDNTVTSNDAFNVNLDANVFAGDTAKKLVELIGGKGTVLMNEGTPGTPFDQSHIAIAKPIFQAQPGISILEQNTNWNPAQDKVMVAQLITVHPDIAAVWSEGDTAGATAQAFLDAGYGVNKAGKTLPVIMFDGTTDFFNLWHNTLKPAGYQTVGSFNPPGQVVDALWIGLMAHAGGSVKDNPMNLALPLVTNDNLDQYWTPGLSDEPGLFVDTVPVPDRNTVWETMFNH